MSPGNPQRLDIFEENIEGLKEVWKELSQVWSVIMLLKD
jgi:hypothetical protein